MGRGGVMRAATVALVTCACGGPAADSNDGAVADGVTLVRSEQPMLPDTLMATRTLLIGAVDGPPEYVFGEIGALAAGAGRIYVYEIDRDLREYDHEGRFLRVAARAGEGPAEVGYITAMHAPRGGGLVVRDLGNSRLARFGPDGEITHVPLRRVLRPSYQTDALSVHDDGSLWLGFQPPLGPDGVVEFPRPIFARVSEGTLSDTIVAPASFADDCPTLTEREHRQGFWDDRREPFVPKVKWALGPDGTLVVGCPNEYAFTVFRSDGRVVTVSRPYEPVPISNEEKDFLAQYAGVGGLPDQKPAYARLLATGDGRVWVWPSFPSARVPLPEETVRATGVTHTWIPSASGGSFDVFSDDGRWLAVVDLPDEVTYSGFPTEARVVIRGDTLWAVARDSMDVEYVGRYEVRGLSALQRPD